MKEKDLLTALAPGAQLWLIPSLEVSAWARRIDWYLGFQIQRSGPHESVKLTEELKTVIENFEVDVPMVSQASVQASASPLMIASETLLPNHQTVLIPAQDDADWVRGCHKVWSGLGQPLARIFLPKGMPVEKFTKLWPAGHAELVSDLEVVADATFS